MSDPVGRRAHNVLLQAPASRNHEFDACVDMLTPVQPAELNIWSLGITLPPDERLRLWEDRRDAYPDDFTVVSGQSLPQGSTVQRAEELGFDPEPRFVTVQDPANLTDLGVHLTSALERWDDSANHTSVCFHSITALCHYVPFQQAYQFLHPFTTKVREHGATAHYHINPRAHDDKHVQTLLTLFDDVAAPEQG